MSDLDKILEPFGDYGHHDNNGYGDCFTCRGVAKAKQAIQQELLKARINELNKHIAWADENVGGITLSRQQLDDRIANLQAKLKENSDEVQPNE